MTNNRYLCPPELTALLIEVIPRLAPRKDDVLLFFRSAGVSDLMLADQQAALRRDRDSVRKTTMTRDVLTRLLDGGDACLGELRQVIRQVEEFEDFSTCWPSDRLPAQGLVGQVRRVRNVKDSFTRLQQEKGEEERRKRAESEATAAKAQHRRQQLAEVQRDVAALFAETDPARRGKRLEPILNRWFDIEGIKVRDSFTISGNHGEGVVDQIDGVISLDGELYLVEMRWTAERVGVEGVSRHLTRVYGRGCARGMFISGAGYTEAARQECRRALAHSVFVLAELEELVDLLEAKSGLRKFLRAKVEAAVVEQEPLIRPLRAG